MGSNDYSYDDNEQVELHDSDSSQNTATALDGYAGTIVPVKDWPGANPNPKEQRARPEDMREVAERLLQMARDLKGSRIPGDVKDSTSSAAFGPQNWQAASYLKTASTQAAGHVVGGVDQVAANLEAAAKSIKAAADGYENADSTNAAGMNY